ncbi:MAG: GumC family protein [Planctomycetes bacterium]|nr:GumC family protein [Planctomycetota bacterium]
MHNNHDNLISLRDCVRLAFRHKFKAAVIFTLTLGFVTVVAIMLPKKYTSEAKLFIRLGRTGVALDPTATVGQTVAMGDTRERELNSALEILSSRELLNDVVGQVGANVIVEQSARFFSLGSFGAESQESAAHKAIETLEESLSRNVARDSNVINVSCNARSPQLAQLILQSYVQAFKAHHTRLHRTTGSHEFFEAQTAELEKRLAVAESELRDAKNELGVGSIEGEKKLIEGRLTALQSDLIDNRTALASSNAKISSLVERHPDLATSSVEETTDSTTQELSSMRSELFKLEIQERELLTKLAPNHPKVKSFKDQVVQARRLFERQQLIGEKAMVRSLEVEMSELNRQCKDAKQTLLTLNESAIRINKLTQEAVRLRHSFVEYQSKSEQARIDGAMDKKHISDVNIAQAATFNPKHISPKKSILLGLGFIAAMCSAIGIVMLSEYFDDSFQSPEQIESMLEVPVVLSVPNAKTETLAV